MARTEYEEEALRLYNARAPTHRAYASVRPIAPGPLAVTVTVNDVAIPISGVSSPGGTVLTLEGTPDGVVIAGAICRVGLPGWSGADELGNYEHVAVYVQADVPPRVAITHRLATAESVAVVSTTHDPDFHYLLTATSGVGQWINDVGYLNTGKESFNDIIQETQGGDAMPWASIITFILSFVLSKKSGKSTATAALTGLAAGGATYLLADPTNPDNLFGIGVDSGSKAPGTAPPVTTTPSGSTGAASLGQAIGGAVNGAGNAISNMGPGTAALVGGAAGLTLAGKSDWLLWGGLAIGAYLLLKD